MQSNKTIEIKTFIEAASAYNFLAFGIFGVSSWLITRGISGVIAVIFIGELVGFIAGLLWAQRK